MTIRQLWVRIHVVLENPESPLRRAIERDREAAEEDDQLAGMDDALAMVGG